MQYVAAIGPKTGIVEKFYADPAEAENFARAHDRSPLGVYDCVAELLPRAARHGRRMENVASVSLIHVDVDVKPLMATWDEIHGKLTSLPAPFELRDSGTGFHVVQRLKEPAHAGTEALERIIKLRTQLTTVLAGDRACDHNVSLLRRVGTHNHKGETPKLCQVIRPGTPVDLGEAGTLISSLGVRPLFGRGAADPMLNPRGRIVRAEGADDPFALLEQMAYRGAQPINRTQLLATKALLFDGVPLWRVTQIVLGATRDAVGGNPACTDWDWRREEEAVASMCYRAINLYPKLYPALEPVHRAAWSTRLATGKTPRLVHTRNIGWVVDDAPEPPPKMADIDGWFRQVMDDTHLTGCALRHVYFNILPAIRTEGYVQIRPAHAAQTIREPRRTVERAHSLLVARGHLCRIVGGGRIPRYLLTISAKNGGSGEISK
jgi:hypothetical protein